MSSPTARLLQSSRLFSLPKPLPAPNLDRVQVGTSYKSSPTATLPYPTHQTITAPPASLHRGDWGLKRALPTKTIRRTSTPLVRIKAQDNTEHITPFESAADLALSEAKWRQMGIAITHQRTSASQKPVSVYDEEYDNTDPEGLQGLAKDRRWKRAGPVLEEMQDGEFENYITQKVAPRKEEFQKFLKQRIYDDRVKAEISRRRDNGENLELSSEELQGLAEDVELTFPEELKKLRDAHAGGDNLGSDLTSAICEFLDMYNVVESNSSAFLSDADKFIQRANLDSKDASPPSTHQGAGLSYLRTNAIMENHPHYGPQAQRSPILARVLMPHGRTESIGVHARNGTAILGVGGFVAEDKNRKNFPSDKDPADPPGREHLNAARMAWKIDPDLAGGNKYYVTPASASIESSGRVRLQVDPAQQDAVMVKMGLGEEVRAMKAGLPLREQQESVRLPPLSNSNTAFNPRPQAKRQALDSQNEEDDAILESLTRAAAGGFRRKKRLEMRREDS